MKMKHISIIALLTGMIMFTSCEQFLYQEPVTEKMTKDIFSDVTLIEELIPGAYQPMRREFNSAFGDSYCMTHLYTDVRSDDVIIENSRYQPHGHGFQNYVEQTTGNVMVQGIWAKFYDGVAAANEIIRGLLQVDDDVMDPATRDLYLSEARFLRAWYYFELVKNFGEVPLFGNAIPEISNPADVGRKPISEVYAQIEEDLLAATEGLPEVQTEPYRATKGAAIGILAKVYLYQEKYTEAAEAAQDVIDMGIYELEESYEDNFKVYNEFGKESIFEISYTNDLSGGTFNASSQTSLTLQFFGPRFSPVIGGWNYNLPTPGLVEAFQNEGDSVRLHATVMMPGRTFDSPILDDLGYLPITQEFIDERINNPDEEEYGYGYFYSLKYFMTPEDIKEYGTNYVTSNLNHKVLRYADILLVLAEATLHGGAGDGQAAFDQVRARAGLSSKTLTMEALKLERRLELATEWNRFHDLLRWGDAASKLEP